MPAENTKFSSISRAICYFVPRKSYSGKTRFHRWNDFDRLTFSLGHDFCGYYGYDADGIRTYKLMGTCNISTQNGGGLQAQAVFDDMVLYPSPYMVVTPRGYTNHYYAGSERIASRVGNRCWSITPTDEWEIPSPEEEALQNFWNIAKEEYPFGDEKGISSPTTNVTLDENYDQYVQYSCTPVFLPEVDVLYNQDMIKTAIGCGYSGQNEAPVYYYHPDHLGSTSWVTDEAGHEHQFIAYLPYGEPLLNVLYDNYDSRYGLIKDARYKFTGKERDAETGYDYMEQRYYYPPLAFWLRPDPLLDKYIHLSPYVYCNGNPLKYVDPEGELPTPSNIAFLVSYYHTAHVLENKTQWRWSKTVGYGMLHPYNTICTGLPYDGYSFNISSRSSNFACNISNALFPFDKKSKNIYRNTLRHAIWQAILTNTFGIWHAERIGNSHENSGSFDTEPIDTEVDKLNNIIGRNIAFENQGLDNKTLVRYILDEFRDNGLWVANDDYGVQKIKLTQEQYDNAIQVLEQLDNNGLYEK